MKDYISLSHRQIHNDNIQMLANTQEPIIIWGAGSFAQSLLKTSPLTQCNIIGIVDRDPKKQGLSLMNHAIQHPNSLREHKHTKATILVTSIPFYAEIMQEINRMELQNRVVIA